MFTTMASSVSIWARIKTRCVNWQHQSMRYEYPEAHRGRNDSSTTTTSSSSSRHTNSANNPTTMNSNHHHQSTTGKLNPDELLNQQLYDHPLHRSPYHGVLQSTATFLLWTVVHCGAAYVLVKHVKPMIHRYLECLDDDDDDDDDDGNIHDNNDLKADKTLPKWKRKLIQKWTKNKTRLCCCCDHHVSSKDKYCPICGAPTCPLCVYCGAGIQNNVNFCPSCGRPVPNQIITMDGGGGGGGGGGSDPNNNSSMSSIGRQSPPPPMPQPSVLGSNRIRSSGSVQSHQSHPQQQQQQQGQQNSPPSQHRNSYPGLGNPPNNAQQLPVASFSQHAAMPPPKQDYALMDNSNNVDDAMIIPMVQVDDVVPMVSAVYVEEVTVPLTATTLAADGITSATATAQVPIMAPHAHPVAQQSQSQFQQQHQQQFQQQQREEAQQQQIREEGDSTTERNGDVDDNTTSSDMNGGAPNNSNNKEEGGRKEQ